ncbi:MAG: hypothetical protein ABIO79_00290 [Ferruginibacter sp.]
MKKYFLIVIAFFIAGSLTAQDTKPNLSRNTVTTINGIPYSQYKAQQDALKQATLKTEQNQLKATPQNVVVPVNAADLKSTPVKPETVPAQKAAALKGSGK